MRVLGVDPGTNLIGFGVIEGRNKIPSYIYHSVVDLRRIKENSQKLTRAFKEINWLIDNYNIDVISLEKAYGGKDYHASDLLNQVRGVIILAAGLNNISVYEYPPAKVKKIITGNGRAEKFEVAKVLEYTLSVKLGGKYDATDALAIALTHFYICGEKNDRLSKR